MNKDNLEKIGKYLLEGLSEDEACIMCDVDPSDFRKIKEGDIVIRKYIEKKVVDFKHIHLQTIQTKKSEKNSQWLLEKLRPEEFGTKVNKNPTTVNIISQIIKNIQNNEEYSNIVPTNRAQLIEEREENDTLEVESVLK